jgi:hypothetical protein
MAYWRRSEPENVANSELRTQMSEMYDKDLQEVQNKEYDSRSATKFL